MIVFFPPVMFNVTLLEPVGLYATRVITSATIVINSLMT